MTTSGATAADSLEAARRVATHLAGFTYPWMNESELQRGIASALSQRFEVRAEVTMSPRDRPDFLATAGPYTIAVEVKVHGARAAIWRQLGRYAEHDRIDAVVLAAGRRALLAGLPQQIHGKAVLGVYLGAQLR